MRSPLAALRDRLTARRPTGLPRTVDARTALDLVADGALVLDVRETGEWRTGHAPRALHVPLADIATAPGRLPAGARVVVMCASGLRSRTGAAALRSAGVDATSLSGGIAAWRAAGGTTRR
ncbi:rhodanese-like domain-containing protein [Cellulomonas sp. 179-A 4D5 NHS]|uniref:rhodanese-like domain-containing protein n=1 Tax=Cellulomonas sp. 179-A 4D5 NHS TaxID=3142378 RepID=UPI00399FCF29